MAGRQRDQTFPMRVQERAGADEQRAGPALDEGCKGGLDVAVAADIENDELLPDRLRRGLHVVSLRLGRRGVRVHEHANCCRLGHELAQQLQSLRPQHAAEKAHARDVAARPVEAGDEAVPDRVAAAREDDRHRRGCGLGRQSAALLSATITATGRRIRSATRAGNRSVLTFRRAEFDRDVLALDEARFLQALAKRGDEVRHVGERRAAEKPDHRHRRLLRARGKRPCGRAAEPA